MKFITMDEFESMKLYELDNVTYNRIERAFIKVCGYAVAAKLMKKFAEKTLRELSVNSIVDIMSELTIL